MRKTLTINNDKDLLTLTANCFGFNNETNYSQLIEQALLYFLKPQISYTIPNKNDNTKIQ